VLSGDQHLATFARLGIDSPSDAVYQMCTPAMGNIFWRWFYPNVAGEDRKEGEPEHLGEFTDGYGNYFRMIAVANPDRKDLLGDKLRRRVLIPEEESLEGKGITKRVCQGEGYAVLRFDKSARTVGVECWPYDADPTRGDAQYQGWPITLDFDDLDGRKPVAWLPDLKIQGASDPVVQVIDQGSGEIMKITRAHDGFYRPGVFEKDTRYTLRVGDPGAGLPWWEKKNLKPLDEPGKKSLKVKLRPR